MMLQEMKKRVHNEKGLTLIELLAVIVILAIIAAIAIPAIGNIISNSRDKAILSEALNIISGAKIAHMDGQCTGNTCDADDLAQYVEGLSSAELAGISATLSTDNKWQITHPDFANIKNDRYKAGTSATDTTATEEEIKTALDPGASISGGADD